MTRNETKGLWPGVLGCGCLCPDAAHATAGHAAVSTAWLALLYVGVLSMWAGFFDWFRGLSWGGALQVSHLQLLQPFISMLAAVPLLGESLDTQTLGFALLVVATVFMGRRMAHPHHTPADNDSRSTT